MFATIEDVKGKLRRPLTDSSDDAALELVLAAASKQIEEATGYASKPIEGRVQTFRNVEEGRLLKLDRRPVSNVAVAGRLRGDADSEFTPLLADVQDASRGELVLLTGKDWWPPVQRPTRDLFVWPVVRVTYDVAGQGEGFDAPPRLRDVTAALAVYWFERHAAGASESRSIGKLAETLASSAIPAWVLGALGDDDHREHAGWV